MSELLVAREGPIMVITLNRPEVKNALNSTMTGGLARALDEASVDLEIRAVVLTGAGTAFSSGADTNVLAGEGGILENPSTPQTRHSYTHGIQEMTRSFYRCEVPIIAAVNGLAYGLGFDLTTQCDIRIASETASFSEAFVTIGLIPGDGGFWHLPRIVGYSRAVEMTITGHRIDAATAEKWGLVSQVVPEAQALTAALTLAEEVANRSPHSVRMSKRLIRDAMGSSLEGALSSGAMAQAVLTRSHDQREAFAALLAKRPGEFAGR